jgi:hypothetical protein|tara:strand:- start:41 stop:298 length:258 start_codon:yes stop_codon:yes gene_type:complete
MFTHSELRKLSIEDLRELQTRIKYVINDKVIEDHEDIKVGSWVKINHRKCIGKKYTVEKINRKTYILNDGKGARIKASLGLIESI